MENKKHYPLIRTIYLFALVGLPLYFYHWSIIRRETKEKGAKTKAKEA